MNAIKNEHNSAKLTHLGVYGVILKNQQILLVKKRRGPYRNLLDLPGGRIEHGESPSQTLVREIQEETGVFPKNWVQFENTSHVCSYKKENSGVKILLHHLAMIYQVHDYDDSNVIFTIQHEDVEGCVWHKVSQINGLSPFAKIACLHFSSNL